LSARRGASLAAGKNNIGTYRKKFLALNPLLFRPDVECAGGRSKKTMRIEIEGVTVGSVLYLRKTINWAKI
jgi:hypothetical protein